MASHYKFTRKAIHGSLEPPSCSLKPQPQDTHTATHSLLIMRRKIHDPTVVHSSIVLLRERFRQLQRVKEIRKERELLKMLCTEPKHFNSNATTIYEPTSQFFHPELIIPSRSSPHVSLSLWPTSQCMQEDNKSIIENPVSMKLLSIDCTHAQSLQASWKNNVYDWDSGSDSGVDTSLHLFIKLLQQKMTSKLNHSILSFLYVWVPYNSLGNKGPIGMEWLGLEKVDVWDPDFCFIVLYLAWKIGHRDSSMQKKVCLE
ncbi:hypothetical protein VNO77_06001 [Canavalia gladiata]|uniref:Uncharacterized protein n=1 Tax=Canavalia gladiata TaxID=3824 RepID=A0AAN9R961_CANGL